MKFKGQRRKAGWVVWLVALGGSHVGCTAGPSGWGIPGVTRILSPGPVVANPLLVPSSDFETVWSKTVAAVNNYFPIASENRLAGTIRTEVQMAGTLVEPWSSDSATFRDRFEATLQTIRK